MSSMVDTREVIILGSGAAGLTAAIYTGRANMSPLLFEGTHPGGQLTTTTEVENYPGFEDAIMGPDLMKRMHAQAARFGTEIIHHAVESVNLGVKPIEVVADGKRYTTKSLIIATGAEAKLLGLVSEAKLMGHGVSACATCDGFFFKNQRIVVVGGGDTALEEAQFLTKFASSVKIVHRRDALRGSKIMQDRAFGNPKISFIWDSIVEEVLGPDGKVTGVRLRNLKSDVVSTLEAEGLFIAIGHTPNTKLLEGQLELLPSGYVRTFGGTRTSVPGVFAAGDVQDSTYRQAVTAAGSGCMAALDTERYLEELKHQSHTLPPSEAVGRVKASAK